MANEGILSWRKMPSMQDSTSHILKKTKLEI